MPAYPLVLVSDAEVMVDSELYKNYGFEIKEVEVEYGQA
jgi:hypothetical protein